MTVLEILFIDRQPTKLFKVTELRYKSFARLWAAKGQFLPHSNHVPVLPCLRVHKTDIDTGEAMSVEMPGPITALLQTCSGTVLDIGPGSGEMLSRFVPHRITAMYGAEPAEDLHPKLKENALKHGFEGRYHPLVCGGEPDSLIPALAKCGLLGESVKGGTEGVFDEIVCVRVLCGVPRPRETVKGLYGLLKPGGRMVICEHVVNPWRTEGKVMARIMQVVYTLLGWPFFMGGCQLQRHTELFLREAGEWEKFDLQYVAPKDAIPFVVGDLIKSGTPKSKASKPTVKSIRIV
jgi:SAM-dependent methyltransferase